MRFWPLARTPYFLTHPTLHIKHLHSGKIQAKLLEMPNTTLTQISIQWVTYPSSDALEGTDLTPSLKIRAKLIDLLDNLFNILTRLYAFK